MIRILHVFGKLDIGGAESRIMDLYRAIDRKRVQFDFVVHTDTKGFFEDEIEAMGGRIFRVPRFKMTNFLEYKKGWKKLLKAHGNEFEMIQAHMTSTAAIYLPIAKSFGVRYTISHVRSAGVDPGIKGIVTRFLRLGLKDKADFLFTCSGIAAISAYGLKAVKQGRTHFIPNAIDTGLFRFDMSERKKVRASLGLDDELLFGHVGRFHYAKNHEFLISVFAEINNKCGNERVKLLLVGDGPEFDNIKDTVYSLGIEDKVIFVGSRKDAYCFYNAMDYFIYPSRYEGLPGAVVEAQANGLRGVISDSICEEVMVTDIVSSLSLDKDAAGWAEYILNDLSTVAERDKYADIVSDAGFDIGIQAEKMLGFYETADIRKLDS